MTTCRHDSPLGLPRLREKGAVREEKENGGNVPDTASGDDSDAHQHGEDELEDEGGLSFTSSTSESSTSDSSGDLAASQQSTRRGVMSTTARELFEYAPQLALSHRAYEGYR